MLQQVYECTGIRNIRSQDYSFPRLFVPMMELSFSRSFVPWNIRSQERISLGTFVFWTFRHLEISYFYSIKENLQSKMANYIFM